MELLRAFWEKQGRILVLLDPTAKTPKLQAFISELGVRVNDNRLMANVKTGIQEVSRIRDVVGRFRGESAITKRLEGVQAPFLGATASLAIAQENPIVATDIKVQPLAVAERGYWGEVDYNSDDETVLQFTQGRDQEDPLYIAASIEKGGSADERVQANSSRMVVVSNATFVQDEALTQGQQGLDFISGSLNWLMNREALIGIAPKVPQTLTFTIEENAMANLKWLILVLMPLVPGVIGVAVWWQRRA
jgi:hypothetical protein